MKPYLGFGVGEDGYDNFTIAVFFIDGEDIEDALAQLQAIARRHWDMPVMESLTLLPPGRIPTAWLELFTGEEIDSLADYTVQANTSIEMVA